MKEGCRAKYELVAERGQKCEYPQGCNETRFKELTVDHFTPKCIARMLGWSRKQVQDPMNKQLLCKEHHRQKDESTPDKVFQLREQRKGKFIGFGEHK